MRSDLHTLSGAYAIDALSPEEAQRFRTHMAACAACRQEVRELRAAAAEIGATESVAAPSHLKARVLAAAERTPQLPPVVPASPEEREAPVAGRFPRLALVAAAVALIAAAAIGYVQIDDGSRGSTLAADVVRVFEAEDAHEARMETSIGGEVAVATSPSLNRMAIDAQDLPELDAGQVYQLWAVQDGAYVSAGVLADPDQGAAMEMPSPGVQVAITIEPAGGSAVPSDDPIMSVEPAAV